MTWRSIKDDPPPADTPVRVGGYDKGYGDQAPLQWRENVAVVLETERGWFGRKRIVARWVVGDYTYWMPLPQPPEVTP